MKKCSHQFFKLTDIVVQMDMKKIDFSELLINTQNLTGIRVICALCGECRDLWGSGEVKILSKKK